MRMNEAFPKQYMTKTDGDPPFKAEIDRVLRAEVVNTKDDERSVETIVYLRNVSKQIDLLKGIVVNKTNWALIASIRGEDPDDTDTDQWPGTEVVVWNDMSVSYNGVFGGLRFRAVQTPVPATPLRPVQTATPATEGPPLPPLQSAVVGTDDVPF